MRIAVRSFAAIMLLLLLAATSVQAAATIAITSPADGAQVSRSATPTLLVSGTAAFDEPVAATRTFYLRRDDCGGDNDNPHMSVRQGSDGGSGCGYLTGLQTVNTVFVATGDHSLAQEFTAVDGVPFTIDSLGKVGGTLVVGGLAGGQATHDITVTGVSTTNDVHTLLETSETITLDPSAFDHTVTFEGEVDDVLAGVEFRSITFAVNIHGPILGEYGYIEKNGASKLDVPIMDAGTVEVAADSATFSAARTVTATVKPDGTWEAEVATPATGERKIHARAVQGATKITAVPVGITVLP
jgi:hypothetical protein